VVWKPAELVPLTAMHLLQALVDAGLPKGVLNMVLGKGSEVGEVLTTHQGVDAISFTGSNPVGRSIQLKATQHGKKVQLEMGGKNPSVVLADADLPLAVEQVARGAFLSAGQKCTATSRVIVEKPVVEEFQERLGTIAKSWKLGNPLEEDTKVGPVVSKDQMQTVLGYIEMGEKEGGHFVAGGKRAGELGDGYYVQPTVITDLGHESRVSREEIFGPVATILPASSYEEAVKLANDTPFGLTASLFTNDLTKALRFVNDIRVGVVKINQESAGLEYQVPFGGAKESSSGSREQGQAAKEFFTQWKTVYMDQLPKG
jgi:aldehyde dehydrogenase (NAD+)